MTGSNDWPGVRFGVAPMTSRHRDSGSENEGQDSDRQTGIWGFSRLTCQCLSFLGRICNVVLVRALVKSLFFRRMATGTSNN